MAQDPDTLEQESDVVGEVKPRELSEREQRMEEIAMREWTEQAKVNGQEPPVLDDPAPVAEERKPAPEPEANDAPAPVVEEKGDQPIILDGDLSKYKVKAKVDGQDAEVSLEDALRQYQKNTAADKRLAEASRILKAAEDAAQARNTPEPVHAPAPAVDDGQEVDAIINALWDNERDKAKEALTKALKRRQPEPTVDPSKLVEQIAPQIKQQIAVENALAEFRKANADIVDDPYLTQITEKFWDEEISGGKPLVDALSDAGKRTRDWLKSKGIGAANPSPTITRDEKRARKEGIDNIPSASARASSSNDEREPTPSEVMAEMRAKRGLLPA